MPPRRNPIVAKVMGVAVLALMVPSCRPQPTRPPANRPVTSSPPPVAAARRPDDFVGSGACATCHTEIAAAFAAHPMGRSLGPIEAVDRIETRSTGPVAHDRERRYFVEERDGHTVHVERVEDAAGTIYEQSVAMHFALGSGRRGRAYLAAREGQLFQSPLGWYTQRNDWNLSPGYRDDRGLRFERMIDNSCLYCHAGRTEAATVPNGPARRFTERIFFEAAIGCERCHGPGGRHVARMERSGEDGRGLSTAAVASPAAAVAPDTGHAASDIVNPARLTSERREAVCNQCHLAGVAVIPRTGHGFFDVRPGDLLDDTLVVLTSNPGDRREAVSHVEQMRASRCFAASSGALGCTSCHDPHAVPAPDDRTAFFRQRCIACHATDACALPAARRDAVAADSCIACHMPRRATADVPHTALTDHTIPRRPADQEKPKAMDRTRHDHRNVTVFEGGAARLPAREVDRALGLWNATLALRQRDPQRAATAVELLMGGSTAASTTVGMPETVIDDVPVLVVLGELFAATGRGQLAEACYARVLALDPDDEVALAGLSALAAETGDLVTALEHADRLTAVSPFIAEAHIRRAGLLAGRSRWQECREAAERAVGLDPTAVDAQRLLAEACRRTGDDARAAAVEARLRRLLARQADGARADGAP
jgi:hypothetical protein